MGIRRHVWAILALGLSAQFLGEARAQSLTTYLESSGTEQKPRSNAGVAVQNDWFRMRADFALRAKQTASPMFALRPRPSGSTEVMPNLRSAFKIAENLDLETRVNFAEWNAHTDTTFDTRLRYKKSLGSFFDEIDGSLWRSPEGSTSQSVRLKFDQAIGDAGDVEPLTISGQAIFEATQHATALPGLSDDTHKVAIETKVAGFMSTFLTADHTLSFRAEKTVGKVPQSASTLTYGQSWSLSHVAELGLDLRFLRQTSSPADDFEPSIGVSWRGEF